MVAWVVSKVLIIVQDSKEEEDRQGFEKISKKSHFLTMQNREIG